MIMERGLAMGIVIGDDEARSLASMIVGATPFEDVLSLPRDIDGVLSIVLKDAIGKLQGHCGTLPLWVDCRYALGGP
jgi:hypothetical protein